MRLSSSLLVAAALINISLPCVVIVATATLSFNNCTEHFAGGQAPAQLPVHIALCKGGALAISYDPPMLNPHFSAWRITGAEIRHYIPGRVSGFRSDPDLLALGIPQSNSSSAVWSKIYNRGHLAPSRMLSYSQWSKFQTYYYSNVAPQWWQFNQQSWEHLESNLFAAAGREESTVLYLVTGIEYKNRSKVVFDSGIAVPDYYFTAVCDAKRGTSVGFVGLNAEDGGGIVELYRTVLELELFFSSTRGPIFDPALCNTAVPVDVSFWNFSHYNTSNADPPLVQRVHLTLSFAGSAWESLLAGSTTNSSKILLQIISTVRNSVIADISRVLEHTYGWFWGYAVYVRNVAATVDALILSVEWALDPETIPIMAATTLRLKTTPPFFPHWHRKATSRTIHQHRHVLRKREHGESATAATARDYANEIHSALIHGNFSSLASVYVSLQEEEGIIPIQQPPLNRQSSYAPTISDVL